jgi:hypothetical protein
LSSHSALKTLRRLIDVGVDVAEEAIVGPFLWAVLSGPVPVVTLLPSKEVGVERTNSVVVMVTTWPLEVRMICSIGSVKEIIDRPRA